MSETSQGPGWWVATDGRWYPPETHPAAPPHAPVGRPRAGPMAPGGPARADSHSAGPAGDPGPARARPPHRHA